MRRWKALVMVCENHNSRPTGKKHATITKHTQVRGNICILNLETISLQYGHVYQPKGCFKTLPSKGNTLMTQNPENVPRYDLPTTAMNACICVFTQHFRNSHKYLKNSRSADRKISLSLLCHDHIISHMSCQHHSSLLLRLTRTRKAK